MPWRSCASSWTDGPARGFDQRRVSTLWRAVGVGYASAYGRYPADAHPAAIAIRRWARISPRAATDGRTRGMVGGCQRHPAGAGVGIVDPNRWRISAGGLQCLRGL
jgi:hydroxybutyrate-dimer hydrolase